MIRPVLLLLPILFFSITSDAQQFGAFPPHTKWKQINTDTARIIYSPASEAAALRVATIIHAMAATNNTLGNSLRKINVVLHNRTTLANGYVGLAPFRSEYYLIPGGNIFDFGNLPWQDQLAVHEYRHVQQYNNFNRGLTRVAGTILGEEGRALANAFAIPDWFFEGDAVYAETVLTPQGRGRMPYFLKGYNSLWKEGRVYNWMKLRNGSYKDFVPNHYPLGYLLVNYGYLKYGALFWGKVTADASAFKGGLYPFQKAVDRHSGTQFKTFRTAALKFYSHEVSRRRDNQKKRETVTNYYHPQVIGRDSLLYVKDSYESLPHFYIKTGRGEHAIKLKNITGEDWFSYRNGIIAYTAYNTSPRWSLVDHSDIILLHVQTGKERSLTAKGKYFTPDISPDGKTFIAVSVNDSITSEMHLLNGRGEVVRRIAAPPNSFFIQPRFIDSGTVAVGIRRADATISLEQLHLSTGKFDQLMAPTAATIGFPFVNNGFVYFTSSSGGSDDIYSLRINDKKLSQLTSGGTGSYFPSVYNDTLYYSAFTSNGYKMNVKALNQLSTAITTPTQMLEQASPHPIALANKGSDILTMPLGSFPATGYNKSTNLLNFHSWRPFYEAPEYSFSVYSNNVLNTFSGEVFYRYNENESSHALGATSSYGGFFALINAGADYTFDRHVRTATTTYTLNQTEARLGYSVPLNFTRGKTYKFFGAGSNFVFNALQPTGASKGILRPGNTTYLHHFVNWSQQLPKAKKQIFPKLAYAVSTAYRHRTDRKGYQALAGGRVYLPALFPTHSLVFSGGFQETDTNNVVFSNRFAFSRGYNDRYFSRMWRGGANYHFPLLYPDRGLANIVYLLRVRSNIFYDHTRVFAKDKKGTNDLRSAGSEILFDTRWWNQLPVSFGVRYSYLFDANRVGIRNPNVFEFIMPVNLIPD